jgi:hypothetical protein
MEGKSFDVREREDGTKERIYKRPGDISSHEGIVTRSPREETLRKWGLRSQRETVERELGYRTYKNTRTAEQRARNIPNAMYAAAKRGDTERVKELYEAYAKLTGSEISQQAWDAEVNKNYFTSLERAQTGAKTVTAIKDVARMNAIMEQIRKKYQEENQ